MEKIIRHEVKPATLHKVAFDIFASYGFTIVILSFLFLLTFLGTMEQTEAGLFRTTEKYFNSPFLVHDFFGVVPVPLPGVYTLLIILFFNLVCGAIIRSRKSWKSPGMIIAHLGVLLMLVAGFVTFYFSTKGNMALFEGERSNLFQSYHDWVIEIAEVGPGASGEVLVIPKKDLAGLDPSDTRTFHHDALPFDLTVSGYHENANPASAMTAEGAVARSVDGIYLQGLPLDTEEVRNLAGAYATITEKNGGKKAETILWGGAAAPYTFEAGGKLWNVDMTRQKWQAPFTVVLDKFTHEYYPGTQTPRKFASDITKIEGDAQEQYHISMNAPLRYKGYTFFQESWGQMEDGRVYSQFAVAKNPADHWPLYSCIIITVGMVIHFGQKLISYLKAENKRRLHV